MSVRNKLELCENSGFLANLFMPHEAGGYCVRCTCFALSGWGGYVSQSQKDRIDASFRKACKWRLTSKLYNFDELLFEADRKLFARSTDMCLT